MVLEAYLISDPGVHESAAALAVEAGSWQDPKEYPGMAHFLEHMLFMGTTAYPNESEYMHYIQRPWRQCQCLYSSRPNCLWIFNK